MEQSLIENASCVEKFDTYFLIHLIFNKKGKYNVLVFTTDKSGTTYSQLILRQQCYVSSNSKENKSFPNMFSFPDDLHIIEPKYNNLKKDKEILFMFRSNDIDDIGLTDHHVDIGPFQFLFKTVDRVRSYVPVPSAHIEPYLGTCKRSGPDPFVHAARGYEYLCETAGIPVRDVHGTDPAHAEAAQGRIPWVQAISFRQSVGHLQDRVRDLCPFAHAPGDPRHGDERGDALHRSRDHGGGQRRFKGISPHLTSAVQENRQHGVRVDLRGYIDPAGHGFLRPLRKDFDRFEHILRWHRGG